MIPDFKKNFKSILPNRNKMINISASLHHPLLNTSFPLRKHRLFRNLLLQVNILLCQEKHSFGTADGCFMSKTMHCAPFNLFPYAPR